MMIAAGVACARGPLEARAGWQQEGAAEIYQRIASTISEAGTRFERGYVFSTETATVEGGGESAISFAAARGRVGAMRRLIPLAVDTTSGRPTVVAPRVAALLDELISTRTLRRFEVSGVEVVAQERRDQKVRVVLAIPEGSIPREKIDWPQAVAKVRATAESLVDVALIAEIDSAGAADRRAVLDAFNRSAARLKPLPSASFASLELPRAISAGWLAPGLPTGSAPLKELRLSELEARTAARGGDPELLDELAQRLEALELHAASQAVRSWPRLKIDSNVGAPEGIARVLGGLGAASVAGQAKDDAARRVRVAQVLLSAAGSWPIDAVAEASPEARQLFAENQVPAALARLLDDCQANPSADALSLASACLFNLNEHADAARIAELAFAARPAHQYAGVNLARSWFASGRVAAAKELARKLKDTVSLDDWGRDRIADLLHEPKEPAAGGASAASEASPRSPTASASSAPAPLEGDFEVQEPVRQALAELPRRGSGGVRVIELGEDLVAVAVGFGTFSRGGVDGLGVNRSDLEGAARRAAVIDAKAEVAGFVSREIATREESALDGQGGVASRSFTQSRIKRQLVAGLREWRSEVRWEGGTCVARAWLVSDAVGEKDSKGFVKGIPCFETAESAGKQLVRKASRGLCWTGVIWVYVGSDASRELVPVAISVAKAGSDRELLSMMLQADLAQAFRTAISQVRTLGTCSSYDPLSPEGAQWVFKEHYSSVTDARAGEVVNYFSCSGLQDEFYGGQRYVAVVGARGERR
jgi:hypothetical protein